MGEETERLRREIDLTRQDLTRDVDRIADKTSPSRMMERRVERAKGGIRGLKERVMGTPHYGRSSGYSSGYRGNYGVSTYPQDLDVTASGPYGSAGEDPSRPASARESVAGTSVAGTASGAVDSARESLGSARDSVVHAGERAQGVAHDSVSTVREQTAGNPIAAGVVAFGIGWLVSSLLPASEAETEAAQRAADVARERGGPIVDQAKQVAQDVGHELQGSAAEAAQQVKERAQDAAGSVREEAKAQSPTGG